MKLSTNTSQYTSTITTSAEFGINEEDMTHIMGIMRSQIYTDKPLAVIREYSTNAVDANVEAGLPDQPITVHLPTLEEPYISFRDYGKGLTADEVTQLYVKYGASTKRNSNDYTGCLGIGCKAGFAYGDRFQIITHTTDTITTWSAEIDQSKRGRVSLLNAEFNDTGETGTEIRVTVKTADIDEFVRIAKRMYAYYTIKPECNFDIPDPVYLEDTNDWSILDTSSWSYDDRRNAASILMGNIIYPIQRSQFRQSSAATALLNSCNVLIKAPLGALDIAANRESLEYTQRTIDSLTAMANNMLLDLTNNINKSVKDAPTRLAASIKSTQYNSVLDSTITDQIRSKANWKGQELLHNIRFLNNCCVMHSRTKVWRSGDDVYRNTRDTKVHSTTLRSSMTLCVYSDNLYSEANATRRVRTLQANNNWNPNDKFYVIKRSQLSDVQPTLTTDDYIDLDTTEPLKAARSKVKTVVNGKTKSVRINVCQLTPNALKSARLSPEAEPEIDPHTGKYIYVPLDRFDWLGHPDRLDMLKPILDAIRHMQGSMKATPINGVKKHYVKKLDDNWLELDVHYHNLFNKHCLDKPDHMQTILNATSKRGHYSWNDSVLQCLSKVQDTRLSYFARILLLSKDSRAHHMDKLIASLAYQLTPQPRGTFLFDELEYIKANHALLNNIGYLSVYPTDPDYDQVIADLNKLVSQ